MKQFLLFFSALCPLLLLGQSFTRTAAFRGAARQVSAAAPATCDALGGSTATAASSSTIDWNWSYLGADQWAAVQITATNSGTVCAVGVWSRKINTPVNSVEFAIYSDNAGAPGTRLGDWSAAVAGADFPASVDTEVKVTVSGGSVTNSSVYWVVMKASNVGDAVNYFQWYYIFDDGSTKSQQSSNGASWSTFAVNVTPKACIYIQ